MYLKEFGDELIIFRHEEPMSVEVNGERFDYYPAHIHNKSQNLNITRYSWIVKIPVITQNELSGCMLLPPTNGKIVLLYTIDNINYGQELSTNMLSTLLQYSNVNKGVLEGNLSVALDMNGKMSFIPTEYVGRIVQERPVKMGKKLLEVGMQFNTTRGNYIYLGNTNGDYEFILVDTDYIKSNCVRMSTHIHLNDGDVVYVNGEQTSVNSLKAQYGNELLNCYVYYTFIGFSIIMYKRDKCPSFLIKSMKKVLSENQANSLLQYKSKADLSHIVDLRRKGNDVHITINPLFV